MLRSAVFRSQAARWSRHRHFFRDSIRHSSLRSPQEGSKSSKTWSQSIGDRMLRYRSALQALSWNVQFAMAGFLFLHIETTYFYTWDMTHGISMMPTMNATGDSVIISKWYRRGRGVEIGDMVTFDHPVDQNVRSIKRVVGLEGDWVCRDTPGVGRGTVIQIPQGHCWVVGDNLSYSRDSRMFGPLPTALIKGKVLARFKLWSDFQWLENGLHPALEDDVD